MAGGRVVRIRVDNAGIDSTIYRIPSGSGGDAAVYKRGGQAPSNETVPMEWSVYGLSFVGVSRQTGEQEEGPVYTRTVGTKFYPLTDHLGSVRVVVGDIKLPVAGGYEADVLASYDYEIYGGPRPGRSLDVSAFWRYGFQGMLKQNELSGNTAATSDYTTLFRTYDARTGRWRSHDPIHQPWESTYLGLAGNPAMLTDPWGLIPGGGNHTASHYSESGGGGDGGRSSSSTRSGSSSQGATRQNAGAGSTVTTDQASITGPAEITPPDRTGQSDIASTYFQAWKDSFVSNMEGTWEGLTSLATSPWETLEEAAIASSSDPWGAALEAFKPVLRMSPLFVLGEQIHSGYTGYQEGGILGAAQRLGEYEGSRAADAVTDAVVDAAGAGAGAVVGKVAGAAAKAVKNVAKGSKAVAKLAKAVDEVAAAGKAVGTLDDAAGTAATGTPLNIGPYDDLVPVAGGQRHHLNQTAAFRDVIARGDGVSIELQGNIFLDAGAPHTLAHQSLEGFWNGFRGTEFVPTNLQYTGALQRSLRVAGLPETQVQQAVRASISERVGAGALGGMEVPRIPRPIQNLAK